MPESVTVESTDRGPLLTAYEERELAGVVRFAGGNSSVLSDTERRQLHGLLLQAGCRGFWGLSLKDARQIPGVGR